MKSFEDGGSSGDDNYFGENTSDLSDTYSEDDMNSFSIRDKYNGHIYIKK
jgi:hypothetical protein